MPQEEVVMKPRRTWIAVLTASVALMIGASSQAALVATQIAPANLQGYWQFDESNSASPPLTNPTPDQSGNSRNGTYQSAAQRVVDGSFSPNVLGAGNQTLYTPNAADQHVSVSPASPLSAFGIGGSFSVSFWINVQGTASQPAPVLVSFRNAGTGGWRIGYNNVTDGSTLRYYIGQHNGGAEAYIYGDNLATPGTWQFLTYTWNSGTSTGTFYINGSLTPLPLSAGTFGTPATPSGVDFTIGASYGGGDRFRGYLDEVAIWNTTLSGAQVGSLYNAYLPEPTSLTLLSLSAALVLRRKR